MICNVAGLVIFLSVCGIVASNPDRAIDCRKFVFAPLCRGVAAKRGGIDNWHHEMANYIDENSFRDLMRTAYLGLDRPEEEDEEEEDGRKSTTKQEESENPLRKYQQDRFLRLFLGNRRRSSETTDNLPGQQFANL